MGKPEGKIENYLAKISKQNGFLYLKFTSPGHIAVPDRCIIGHGLTVFVELKRPGGSPRDDQKYRFSEMKKYGAKVYVVDTKEEADNLITKLLKMAKPKIKTTKKGVAIHKLTPFAIEHT